MKRRNPKREPVEVVAIIPARGGQQSIPWKNLRKLGGKTLLAWAIEVAFEADQIDAVVVSTENARIAREAERLGAIVAPRPKKYSQPDSDDAGWYHHAVTWLEATHGWVPEYLVNLRPTGPLRFASDVDAMIRYLKRSQADGVKSVIPAPLLPYKMWHLKGSGKVGSAGKLSPVFDNAWRRKHGPDQPRQKVQQLYPVHFQDAQIDITRRKFVLRPEALEHGNVWGKNLHGYVLDDRLSVDIDTVDDLRRAEKIYRQLKQERRSRK
ncbi:acylneuraminate cytidylyltransferase family protein [Patescibacteria group bacterium]|nr:acylneuraminate cytidylyltransferase family protein [Patescibacteria group bacterium]